MRAPSQGGMPDDGPDSGGMPDEAPPGARAPSQNGRTGQDVTSTAGLAREDHREGHEASSNAKQDADNDPTHDTAPNGDGGATVAAFFDLDKTIIAGSSTLAFSGPLRDRGLIGRRALIRSGYAQLLLMISGADAEFMDRMRDRISALCAGWDVVEVRDVIDQALNDILRPMIYAEAAELINGHHRAGHHVVVVSASGEEMVRPIAAMLGAQHSVATRMEVADGRYTGEIEFYCYGPSKASAVRTLAERHGYHLADCYAYTDSITDLPLLEVVGKPHAVNPDRALRRIARERGWPVLNFVAPIPLRRRVRQRVSSLLPAPAFLGLGVAGISVAVAAGALWRGYVAARRERTR